MKLFRPLLLAVIFAGGFYYFTTYRSGQVHPANWFGRPSNKVEITEAEKQVKVVAELPGLTEKVSRLYIKCRRRRGYRRSRGQYRLPRR